MTIQGTLYFVLFRKDVASIVETLLIESDGHPFTDMGCWCYFVLAG